MAQHYQLVLTCDVCGETPAAQTVVFGVGAEFYEVELCDVHLAEFRFAMRAWSSNGRPANYGHEPVFRGMRQSRARPRRPDERRPTIEVREWARAKGMPVNARGPLPPEVYAAFEAALEALVRRPQH